MSFYKIYVALIAALLLLPAPAMAGCGGTTCTTNADCCATETNCLAGFPAVCASCCDISNSLDCGNAAGCTWAGTDGCENSNLVSCNETIPEFPLGGRAYLIPVMGVAVFLVSLGIGAMIRHRKKAFKA